MKYIVFWEFCPEDIDKVISKNRLAAEISEKEPERFGKNLFPPHTIGHCKGFNIAESTPEQVLNASTFWFPELKLKFVPIGDVSAWIETYLKTKK